MMRLVIEKSYHFNLLAVLIPPKSAVPFLICVPTLASSTAPSKSRIWVTVRAWNVYVATEHFSRYPVRPSDVGMWA